MGYKVIIFDADETLFDFEKAEKMALKTTFSDFHVVYNEAFHLPMYLEINHEIWRQLEKGKINQNRLNEERFKQFLHRLSFKGDVSAFAKQYLVNLSNGSYLYSDSEILIKTLASDYILLMITNGLKDVQGKRIKQSTISEYFKNIVVSEEVGFAKPDVRIFEIAMNGLTVSKDEILMVGDSISSDIQGGINFGVDTCWFNPHQKVSLTKPTFEISHLTALLSIVDSKK